MKLLSLKKQKLILLYLEKRFIKFDTQEIYVNRIWFKKAIKDLISCGVLEKSLLNPRNIMTTRKGELLVNILKEHQKT